MYTEKAFQITIIASLISHSAIFIGGSANMILKPREPKKVKVVYLKNPPPAPQLPDQIQPVPKDMQPRTLPRIKTVNKIKLPGAHNQSKAELPNTPKLSDKVLFTKPSLFKPDIIAVRKKISLPPIDIEKINNPSYVSYYNFVREKIRRAAYQNYTHAETGEVYLAFVIYSDGQLKDVRLIEERSSANYFLREVALRSIKGAAPFPAFPKELNYPQLSFNVIISFEIE